MLFSMFRWFMIRAFVHSVVSHTSDGLLVQTPSNVTVNVGDSFRLNCSKDHSAVPPIHWYLNRSRRISHGNNGSDVSIAFQGLCSVDTSVPTHYDLICRAVNNTFSGEYTCQEYNGDTSTAFVSVLEDNHGLTALHIVIAGGVFGAAMMISVVLGVAFVIRTKRKGCRKDQVRETGKVANDRFHAGTGTRSNLQSHEVIYENPDEIAYNLQLNDSEYCNQYAELMVRTDSHRQRPLVDTAGTNNGTQANIYAAIDHTSSFCGNEIVKLR